MQISERCTSGEHERCLECRCECHDRQFRDMLAEAIDKVRDGTTDEIAQAVLNTLKGDESADGFDLDELHMIDGHFDLTMSPHDEKARRILMAIAVSAESMLDEHNAENYVEMEVQDGTTGKRYVLNIRRYGGITPHRFREFAEQEADLAKARATIAERNAATLKQRAGAFVERSFLSWAEEVADAFGDQKASDVLSSPSILALFTGFVDQGWPEPIKE